MTRLFVIVLGGLALCSVGSASSNEVASSISTKGPVRAIAADGMRAALVVHTCRGRTKGLQRFGRVRGGSCLDARQAGRP